MRGYIKRLRDEDGFTLIEMLIVIMIVSLLLLLVMTNIGGVQTTIKKTTDDGIVQTVKSQQVIYEMDTGKEATPVILKEAGYINQEQFDAYEKAEKKEAKKSEDS